MSGSRAQVLRWAIVAGVGGFGLGFHAGVVSGVLLFVRNDFGLGDFEQGLLVSALALGAMPGALAAGHFADALGHRRTLLLDAALFMIGAGVAVVGLLFLPVATAIGNAPTFWIFAAVCALGFVFVYRYVPETKGRSFGEVDGDVRERWRREPSLTVVRPRPTGS